MKRNRTAWMLGAAAAIAVIFSFEPLFAAVLKTAGFPPGSEIYIEKRSFSASALLSTTKQGFGSNDSTESVLNLLAKDEIPLISATYGRSGSLSVLAQAEPNEIIGIFRLYLANQSHSESTVILPDQTTMTEIVIDPKKVVIDSPNLPQNPFWTFTQANPQLYIKKEGSNARIFFGNPQPVEKTRYIALSSCRITPENMKTVELGKGGDSLIAGIFHSVLPYLSDYSCFQSFSTIH